MADKDEISYYNRKYAEKNKGIVIPGSFYKVRAQGGAVQKDSDLISQLNKRVMATFGLSMVHAFLVT